MTTSFFNHFIRFVPVCALLAGFGLPKAAEGATIVKQPGAHPRYSFELEPHLVIDWSDAHYQADDGIGLGARFGVPLFHQGPITTINNNMAIGFGFDFLHYPDCDDLPRANVYRDECDANGIALPLVLQWNFYITDLITAFGEPGFMIRYTWIERECVSGVDCDEDDSDADFRPVLEVGAKFMFSDRAGLTVRLGYPHFTVGGSFLF